MGLSINSNNAALGAARQTRESQGLLTRALRQLASGRRIEKAADDAAGLAIAEQFNTRARQSQVELGNLQSGVSLTQTAEGGLSAQQDLVQRLRDLSLQSANGTLNDDQRAAINAEAQQLIQQLDSTAQQTEFNGIRPLDGSTTQVSLGTEGGNVAELPNATAAGLGLSGIDLSTANGAANALTSIDSAQQSLSNSRATLGAQQNAFSSAINQREISAFEATRAESNIRDADLAQVSTQRARAALLSQGNIASLVQANVSQQSVLSLLG